MSNYHRHREDILTLAAEALRLIQEAQANTEMSNSAYTDWIDACHGIKQQLANDTLRIAVIGTIKSGKSTFVNSLFGGDYLKRGAGVVTSIVTRIRKGNHLKASLHFKSWDEVNSEIEQALTLLPNAVWGAKNNTFDIRRRNDRLELMNALASLGAEQLITNDTRNINAVLLGSYLKGYDTVENMITAESVTKRYEKSLFHEHRRFVSNDYLAVYLNDVQIDIGEGIFDTGIEIADCQGSDSPNPLHLAMIQDYLLISHLLVYVVSSRTGLRQADIRFLSMIKKMGILENTMFVVNCDFSEHDGLEDFQQLILRVKEELSILMPAPEIFSFSALYNLFQSQEPQLSAKDKLRMAQWKEETAFIEYSQEERRQFEAALQYQLTKKRYTLLLTNHLKRLCIITSGMRISSRTHQDLLGQDSHNVQDIIKKIAYHQNKMGQVRSMIRSTLDGAIQILKKELKKDIDRFFDVRSGKIVPGLIDLIRNYHLPIQEKNNNSAHLGFAGTLYLVYQEFRQSIDTHMTDAVNPEIIGFLHRLESKIADFLESVARPYNTMVKDAIGEYIEAMDTLGLDMGVADYDTVVLPDLEAVKNLAGLRAPTATAIIRYSARIKTDALMRYGFYRMLNTVRRLFKKSHLREQNVTLQALKDGLHGIKRETETSILFNLKSYRENIKYQYLFKVLDAAALALYEDLMKRFQAYHTDLTKIADTMGKRQADKVQLARFWKEIEVKSEQLVERMNKLLKDIEEV